jgi:hypothetical protein
LRDISFPRLGVLLFWRFLWHFGVLFLILSFEVSSWRRRPGGKSREAQQIGSAIRS